MATENLYTDGSEFKLPNGRRYRGYYHVHPKKGAMVGAVPVDRFHAILEPVSSKSRQSVANRQAEIPPRVVERRLPTVVPPVRPVAPTPRIQSNRTITTPSGGSSGY
jgi:hypothetical protein